MIQTFFDHSFSTSLLISPPSSLKDRLVGLAVQLLMLVSLFQSKYSFRVMFNQRLTEGRIFEDCRFNYVELFRVFLRVGDEKYMGELLKIYCLDEALVLQCPMIFFLLMVSFLIRLPIFSFGSYFVTLLDSVDSLV